MDVIWLIFVATMGLCVGSFMNVIVYRMPRGMSIAFPGSHCPQCGNSIRWYDNIPILSWLILRGRCRFCKKPISPRYLVVEALTGAIVAGLFVCYYMLQLRRGAGEFVETWPMFVAHAVLLCSLLACSIVDIELWIVPLEVCWFASGVGIVCATASPHPFVKSVPATAGTVAIAAAVGLIISLILLRLGLIQPSFIDADDSVVTEPNSDDKPERIKSAAVGKQHGVNPRVEVLRELLFLAPAIILAIAAYYLTTRVDSIGQFWAGLTDQASGGWFAPRFAGFQAALFGYLVGGAWIWGMRIFGTLGFGKEAMGMGDVHILAAVGAVMGWALPSATFFVAPFFGLLWALYLWLGRRQRELPYGPWLGLAAVVVMIFYDAISGWLAPYKDLLLWER